MMSPELHDRVALLEDAGDWPAGTTGTVVEHLPGGVMVELVGPDGAMLDLVDLPLDAVEVVERHPALA